MTLLEETDEQKLARQAYDLIDAGRQDEITPEMWDAWSSMECHLANKAWWGT